MTTEPFPPPATDPAAHVATIAPVGDDALRHAAERAAEQAEAAARATVHDAGPAPSHAEPAPAEPVASPVQPSDAGAIPHEPAAPAADAVPPRPAPNEALRTTEVAVAFEQLGQKVVEVAGANVAAASRYMSSLAGATSWPDVAALQSDYLRRQFDAATTQSRELLLLSQRAFFAALRQR